MAVKRKKQCVLLEFCQRYKLLGDNREADYIERTTKKQKRASSTNLTKNTKYNYKYSSHTMSHILDHQPMDARDVASILDNLADATTEPPTFRHRKFTITQLIFSI